MLAPPPLRALGAQRREGRRVAVEPLAERVEDGRVERVDAVSPRVRTAAPLAPGEAVVPHRAVDAAHRAAALAAADDAVQDVLRVGLRLGLPEEPPVGRAEVVRALGVLAR